MVSDTHLCSNDVFVNFLTNENHFLFRFLLCRVTLDTKPIYDKYNNISELICEEWGVLNSRNSDECRNAIYA